MFGTSCMQLAHSGHRSRNHPVPGQTKARWAHWVCPLALACNADLGIASVADHVVNGAAAESVQLVVEPMYWDQTT